MVSFGIWLWLLVFLGEGRYVVVVVVKSKADSHDRDNNDREMPSEGAWCTGRQVGVGQGMVCERDFFLPLSFLDERTQHKNRFIKWDLGCDMN